MDGQDEAARRWPARADLAWMAGLGLLALSVRLPGLSRGDLWQDDAWMALPARVSAKAAAQLSVTTPLFTQLGRLWLRLWPGSTPFAQLLPLLLSLAVVPATYLLLRQLGCGSLATKLTTALAAVSPAGIQYAMRFKEYSLDELLATLALLALARFALRPSRRSLSWLIGLSAFALACSGAQLLVAGALVAGLVAGLAREAATRRDRRWWIAAVLLAAGTLGAWALWYQHPPKALNRFWAPLEFAVGQPGLRSLGTLGSGSLHGFLGVPLATGHFPLALALSASQRSANLWLAGLVGLGLLAGLALALRHWLAGRQPAASTAVAAIALPLGALAGAFAGRLPFGGGRTDLVWYPGAYLLIGLGLNAVAQAVARRIPRQGRGRALAGVGLCLGLVAAGLLGWQQRAWYPHQDLRALQRATASQRQPGDLVVVAGQNTWAWALYQAGPPRIVTKGPEVDHTKRFGVLVDQPPRIARTIAHHPEKLCRLGSRLWFFGTTASVVSPSAYRLEGPAGRQLVTWDEGDAKLRAAGWQPGAAKLGRGVFAQPWTHPGSCEVAGTPAAGLR